MAVAAKSAKSSERVLNIGHYRILIVGGGTAGISVAARLKNAGQTSIAVVEPSAKHYYQPLWTLVGGGIVSKEQSERPESELIPKDVTWIRDTVASFEPDVTAVVLTSGERIGYDFLVVAPGIQVDWNRIADLEATLRTNGVSSNYRYDLSSTTWEFIRNFKGGTALFTFPAGPINCAGDPQKIMYLAADYFRRRGIKARIIYASAAPDIRNRSL